MTFLMAVGAVIVGMIVYEFIIWHIARKVFKSKRMMDFMAGD